MFVRSFIQNVRTFSHYTLYKPKDSHNLFTYDRPMRHYCAVCLITGKFLTWKSYCPQYFVHILRTFNTEDLQVNYLSVTHITNIRSDFHFSWLLLM